MDQNQRPHSRQKTVGNGSAGVSHGSGVGSGVGSGGRGPSGGSRRGFSAPSGPGGGPNVSRGLPIKLNLKTILILVLVVIVAVVFLRFCGTGLFSGGSSGFSNYTGSTDTSVADQNTASYAHADLSVSPLARERIYQPQDGDDVTVLVYMCGTDLESKHGMASADLREMSQADLGENVNVIVETGGCSGWKTSGISSQVNQIYRFNDHRLERLEDDFGTRSMTDPGNLAQFIRYGHEHFPARRQILIFWDHGGGSISGYGYDEKDASHSSMTLQKIADALKSGGQRFDFIGFDACLMATLETAMVCAPYADYLIGSEETEPGTGWYYTAWLNNLAANTALPTVTLAEGLINDYVAACCSSSSGAQVTLSVTDLAELQGTLPDKLTDFASATTDLVKSDGYETVSAARAGARQFSPKSKLNQVDLIDLADRIGTAEAATLAQTLKSCVKYNKTTISRSHGLSIYFPYENTGTVKNALASCDSIGRQEEYSECMDEYAACIRSFASLEYGGQIAGSAAATSSSTQGSLSDMLGSLITQSQTSSPSPLSTLTGLFGGSAGSSLSPDFISGLLGSFSGQRSMPEGLDWVDTGLIAENADKIANAFLNPERLKATEKDGKRVLSLTDGEWALIKTVELNVYVRDGEGFVDLGLDNTFEWADEKQNDLLLSFDGTWLTLAGHTCAYYLVSDTLLPDGSWTTVGRIPAKLNGELVNLQVVFDKAHPAGTVLGAQPLSTDLVADVQAKGDVAVNAGDEIQLLCDYYGLDGSLMGSYTLGDAFTVPSGGLTLENLKLENTDVSVTYRLTDSYGNHFWVSAE